RDRVAWSLNGRGKPSTPFYVASDSISLPLWGRAGWGLRGRRARGAPAGQLVQRPAERLHVLVDVEHLIGADRSFLGGFGEAVGMLGLLEQQDRDEADPAVGAGHLDRAVAVRLVEQLDLAVGQGLRAG